MKKITYLVIAAISTIAFNSTVSAAPSVELDVPDQVQVGETFEIKVKATGIAAWWVEVETKGPKENEMENCVINDANVTETAENVDKVFTATCKIYKEGTAEIILTGDVTDTNEKTIELEQSKKIKVISSTENTTDNNNSNVSDNSNTSENTNSTATSTYKLTTTYKEKNTGKEIKNSDEKIYASGTKYSTSCEDSLRYNGVNYISANKPGNLSGTLTKNETVECLYTAKPTQTSDIPIFLVIALGGAAIAYSLQYIKKSSERQNEI